LNPIEGLWCNQKQFVRARTDQTFSTMIRLIAESRTNFIEKKIYQKLFRRFWRCLYAYRSGQSYSDVLKLFFSNLCKGNVLSHRKITNTNLSWRVSSKWHTYIWFFSLFSHINCSCL